MDFSDVKHVQVILDQQEREARASILRLIAISCILIYGISFFGHTSAYSNAEKMSAQTVSKTEAFPGNGLTRYEVHFDKKTKTKVVSLYRAVEMKDMPLFFLKGGTFFPGQPTETHVVPIDVKISRLVASGSKG
ncbi:MAG: hypothetical protein QG650_1014 [Patescibacteria group bacterium]|nr:hypothetical protein [Patescibacteria group bacterium]